MFSEIQSKSLTPCSFVKIKSLNLSKEFEKSVTFVSDLYINYLQKKIRFKKHIGDIKTIIRNFCRILFL